jgi:hypothetical protein
MVKIEHNNLRTISLEYFDDIKESVKQRISFFKGIISVVFDNDSMNDLYNHALHWKTKISLINLFLVKDKLNYDSNSRGQYNNLNYQNLKGFVIEKENTIKSILSFLAVESNLKEIILAEPKETIDIDILVKLQFNIKAVDSGILSLITKIFDYSLFDDYAYDISTKLGINTCPYCNRNYINTIIDSNKNNLIRPTFDHFFPKGQHQFLAISFFNLIPSCYYCNSSLKHSDKISHETHLHPYIGGFENACSFQFLISGNKPSKSDPENYTILLQAEVHSESILYKQIFGNKKNEGGNANLFKIQEIYNAAHRDIVGELVVKSDKYSLSQADSLFGFFGLLNTNKAEFYQFYFGNYLDENNFNRRPMAKLTRDTVRQLIPKFFV